MTKLKIKVIITPHFPTHKIEMRDGKMLKMQLFLSQQQVSVKLPFARDGKQHVVICVVTITSKLRLCK